MRTTAKMKLVSWDQQDDEYNYAQLAGNWQTVDFHDHAPGRGVPISAGGLGDGAVTSQAIAAGVVGLQHLSSAAVQGLSLNAGGNIGRASFADATPRTISTTSPSFLTPPDQVTSLNVPVGAQALIDYQALWKTSTGTATATLMYNIGSGWNPVLAAAANGAPASVAASTTATHLSPLNTASSGLASAASTSTDSSESPTGQILSSGSLHFFGPAGIYSFGVAFSTAGGGAIITVQNRHLWARVMSYV